MTVLSHFLCEHFLELVMRLGLGMGMGMGIEIGMGNGKGKVPLGPGDDSIISGGQPTSYPTHNF